MNCYFLDMCGTYYQRPYYLIVLPYFLQSLFPISSCSDCCTNKKGIVFFLKLLLRGDTILWCRTMYLSNYPRRMQRKSYFISEIIIYYIIDGFCCRYFSSNQMRQLIEYKRNLFVRSRTFRPVGSYRALACTLSTSGA